jgi:hypothetical protein
MSIQGHNITSYLIENEFNKIFWLTGKYFTPMTRKIESDELLEEHELESGHLLPTVTTGQGLFGFTLWRF